MGIENAFNELIQLSSEKGFLVFDDIYNTAEAWNLSISDVDYLSSNIITRGILIYDVAPATEESKSLDDEYDDFAQKDYDLVFDRVLELDPELEDFITMVRNIVPPQAKEMDQLKYQVQEGNMYARKRVIQMHLRAAVRIALQRAEAFDCELADTIQDACVGLIIATDKYNPDSGGAFISYASLWMLQNISRTQGTQRPLIYYPVHKKEEYYTMYPVLKEQGYLDREDIWTSIEVRKLVQDKLDCSETQAEDIIMQAMAIESLEDIHDKYLEYLDDEEEREIHWNKNFEAFRCEDITYTTIEQNILKERIEDILEVLTERQRRVIKDRYGFDDGREKTLEEIGYELNVTRERIRQIEAKAMRTLQHPSRIKLIKDYY